MTDDHVFIPKLDQSKLYTLARIEPLLGSLVPDIATQLQVEVDIEESFPREEDDGDDTRILINYRNNKGNAHLYKVLDHERLDRSFAIDGFMDGFMRSIQRDDQPVSVTTDSINATLLTAMLLSVSTILGLNDQPGMTKNTQAVSTIVLQSLIAILFNDALDVMIAVQEKPLGEGQTTAEAMIVGLWIVKQRHREGESS